MTVSVLKRLISIPQYNSLILIFQSPKVASFRNLISPAAQPSLESRLTAGYRYDAQSMFNSELLASHRT